VPSEAYQGIYRTRHLRLRFRNFHNANNAERASQPGPAQSGALAAHRTSDRVCCVLFSPQRIGRSLSNSIPIHDNPDNGH
jgi:hypothetical protein